MRFVVVVLVAVGCGGRPAVECPEPCAMGYPTPPDLGPDASYAAPDDMATSPDLSSASPDLASAPPGDLAPSDLDSAPTGDLAPACTQVGLTCSTSAECCLAGPWRPDYAVNVTAYCDPSIGCVAEYQFRGQCTGAQMRHCTVTSGGTSCTGCL